MIDTTRPQAGVDRVTKAAKEAKENTVPLRNLGDKFATLTPVLKELGKATLGKDIEEVVKPLTDDIALICDDAVKFIEEYGRDRSELRKTKRLYNDADAARQMDRFQDFVRDCVTSLATIIDTQNGNKRLSTATAKSWASLATATSMATYASNASSASRASKASKASKASTGKRNSTASAGSNGKRSSGMSNGSSGKRSSGVSGGSGATKYTSMVSNASYVSSLSTASKFSRVSRASKASKVSKARSSTANSNLGLYRTADDFASGYTAGNTAMARNTVSNLRQSVADLFATSRTAGATGIDGEADYEVGSILEHLKLNKKVMSDPDRVAAYFGKLLGLMHADHYNRHQIRDLGGIPTIVTLMKKHKNEPSVLSIGMHVFGTMSTEDENGEEIGRESGAKLVVQVLTENKSDAGLFDTGLYAMANLACTSANIDTFARHGGADLVMHALREWSDDTDIMYSGMTTVANMSSKEVNASAFGRSGAVEVIVNTMHEFPEDTEIFWSGIFALGNLCGGGADNQRKVYQQGAIEIGVQALARWRSDSGIARKTLLAFVNFAQLDENKEHIAAMNGIDATVTAMESFKDFEMVQLGGVMLLCSLAYSPPCRRDLEASRAAQVIDSAREMYVTNTELCKWAEKFFKKMTEGGGDYNSGATQYRSGTSAAMSGGYHSGATNISGYISSGTEMRSAASAAMSSGYNSGATMMTGASGYRSGGSSSTGYSSGATMRSGRTSSSGAHRKSSRSNASRGSRASRSSAASSGSRSRMSTGSNGSRASSSGKHRSSAGRSSSGTKRSSSGR